MNKHCHTLITIFCPGICIFTWNTKAQATNQAKHAYALTKPIREPNVFATGVIFDRRFRFASGFCTGWQNGLSVMDEQLVSASEIFINSFPNRRIPYRTLTLAKDDNRSVKFRLHLFSQLLYNLFYRTKAIRLRLELSNSFPVNDLYFNNLFINVNFCR